MLDLEQHIANLPDPTKDKMPPRVLATAKEQADAKAVRALQRTLLNPKVDTERTVKYVLEGRLFEGKFVKDGDWATLANGMPVWQKKVSDLVGSVPIGERPNAATYVEVKGVSPGNPFAFSRLDKSNNPRQPSQQEKMTWEMWRGNLAWLAIGWWDAIVGAKPVRTTGKNRTMMQWRKADVELTITLLRWQDWLDIYETHKFRSLRQKDRHLLTDYEITKVGNVWTLAPNHWWGRKEI